MSTFFANGALDGVWSPPVEYYVEAILEENQVPENWNMKLDRIQEYQCQENNKLNSAKLEELEPKINGENFFFFW